MAVGTEICLRCLGVSVDEMRTKGSHLPLGRTAFWPLSQPRAECEYQTLVAHSECLLAGTLDRYAHGSRRRSVWLLRSVAP